MGNKLTFTSINNPNLENSQFIGTNDAENKEGTALIWFDPNIKYRQDTELTKQKLRLINDYVTFHTDLDPCVKLIQSRDKEKIFLITSGSIASQILLQISSLRQVDSVFIFCMKKEKYEYLIEEYSKVIGIYVDLDDLCKSIKEQIDLVDKQLQTFSFFDQKQKSTKDLSKQSAEFLWLQLFNYVIARLPKNEQAKQQMIQMCKEYYRGNLKELKLIDQFEREYRSEEAIRWYTKHCFVYKLINKALRTEDIDLLHTFRFFIGDISQILKREHEKILSSEEEILTVYRGTKLDKEEFDKLKENQGKPVSTNGYFSTSRLRAKAHAFAMKTTKRTDVISVLFQIECNIKQLDENVIFADITQFSEYPDEKEVLFDLNACFTIESIEKVESMQLIRVSASNQGQLITKDYIELTQTESEEISISIVFGRLMCNMGEYEKSLKYFKELLNNPNGEDVAWIEFNIGRALHGEDKWKEAREYYDRAYDRMMNNNPPRTKDLAHVLNNIGALLHKQGEYDKASDYYQRALEVKEKFYPSDHVSIVTSLNNIGNILSKQGKDDAALENHRRALEIKQKCYPAGHVSIAASLNNIGIILKEQENYVEALKYYHRALKMQEKYYPSGHVSIAISLSNIGDILKNQGKYDEALVYYQQALKMREKVCSSGHTDVAESLNSIGSIQYLQAKYDKAIECHERALEILEKFYPEGHIDISHSLNNIGNNLARLGKYGEALDFYQRALEMRKKFYPHDHADVASDLNNIGVIFYRQGKYDEALDYSQRALKMRENYYLSGHINIATSLNNIGLILKQQGKYDEALEYYQRALKIREKCYPSGHAGIGKSLDDIGVIYENQNQPKMALDYYRRALAVYEKFLPVEHPSRVETERNICRIIGEK